MILINHLKTTTRDFYKLYPAASYALCGILFSLLPLKLAFCFSIFAFIKAFRGPVLCGLIFAINSYIQPKELPNHTQTIYGLFIPKKCLIKPSFFKTNHMVEGLLKTDDGTYRTSLLIKQEPSLLHDPCYLSLRIEQSENSPKISILEITKAPGKSLIYRMRKRFLFSINDHLNSKRHEEASSLFSALVTGSIESKLIKIKFSSYGLAHILALSGFHINLLASFCYFMFSLVVKKRLAQALSMIFLFIYFVFIGPESSITRAFSMALFAFLHSFFSLKVPSLHTFCLSLLFTTLICPHQILKPGFVLTFLATLSILCFQKAWSLLSSLIIADTIWEKFIKGWMKLLCLQVFIFVFTLTPTLYFFKQAPLVSLFYNLFVPLIISVFMMGGCVCAILKLIHLKLGSYLLEWLYQGFEPVLSLFESPPAQSAILTVSIPSLVCLASLFLEILLVLFLFKKNQVI